MEAGDEALVEQWDAWKSGKLGKVPAAVLLELIEACQARRSSAPALEERLATHDKALAEKAGTAAAFEECLEGGDAKLGKEIALQNLTANCTACHKFESKEGSTVGPALNLIGKQKDRIYLLEALITPSKAVAPGFGIMTVTLKDGKMLTGTLVANTSSTLQLRLADGALEKVDTAQIESKTDPISVMPPMGAMLNKRQVRDLVAYLASLDGGASKKSSKSGNSPK
ncbi:c-type cytochrome [Verrucomicrobium spinosum]|nr:c-type cytochrome [Verrucomicrobium spinosum]